MGRGTAPAHTIDRPAMGDDSAASQPVRVKRPTTTSAATVEKKGNIQMVIGKAVKH